MKDLLVGDIGGTNARFALWRDNQLHEVKVFATEDYTSPEQAIEAYLEGLGIPRGGVTAACLAVAGPLRAQVRDTDFAVRYLDGEAQVRVQRGDVDLQGTRDQRIRLSAGDSISVGPQGFGQRQRPDMHKDLAWVDGRLVFENCPLSQVLAEVQRYYPGWIINRNAQLEDMAVTGNYRLDQPLQTLRALAHITSAQLHEYPALVILN